MGTWLQEAIEVYDREYKTGPHMFSVNGWRCLTKGFLDYVEDLDLTQYVGESHKGIDQQQLDSFDTIESYCEDLIKVVRFLRKIRPPDKYYYGRVNEDEPCQEMLDALNADLGTSE
jgi:hypothetical protein